MNGLIPKHWALFRRRIIKSCNIQLAWRMQDSVQMSFINLDAFPQTRQITVWFFLKSSPGSDLTSFEDFARLVQDFHFSLTFQMVCLWAKFACIPRFDTVFLYLPCLIHILGQDLIFLGYSFSFCTPLLVLAPAVPAPAPLIKQPVYCKVCTVQPSATKHSDLAHSIVQNSSEEKPSGKCRNRFFPWWGKKKIKKKRALQGMLRCVGGGKLFKKTSLSMVFMMYLILGTLLRASGTQN